jgi:hypothetical protein
MPRRTHPASPTWRSFLEMHVADLISIDFFMVATASFRVLYGFVVLAHARRRIVHFNVSAHPMAEWTARQLLEAFPFDHVIVFNERHLLRMIAKYVDYYHSAEHTSRW